MGTVKHLFILLTSLLITTLSADTAGDLLEQAEFSGGVILHIGSGDGDFTAALHKSENSIIYGLDTSAKSIEAARKNTYKKGLSGKISYSQWNGKTLPFSGNFMNLIICEPDVNQDEVMRVLAPYGTAFFKNGDSWQKKSKAFPATMDHWPQHFHNSSGNAVSKDKQVKPPLYHLQWTGSPRWSRHHDVMSSFSACVSAGGKLFYVFDEGTTYTPMMPTRWKLICRDAFNGTVLWKTDIPKWFPNMHRLKSGPSHLPRRVVATDKRVYATLSIDGPVSIIDTKNGKVLGVIEGSEGTEEIVMEKDCLFLVSDKEEKKTELQKYPYSSGQKIHVRPKLVSRVNLSDHKIAWNFKAKWLAPLSLCTDAANAYFFNGDSVVAVNKISGEKQWASPKLDVMKNMTTNFGPSVLTYKNRVLFTGGENYKPHNGSRGKLVALNALDGKILWESASPASGYQSPENMHVINGMVWQADTTAMSWNYSKDKGGKAFAATGNTSGTGLERGKEAVSFGPTEEAYWFHHRCYPAKATEDFLILSRTGVEFVDLKTQKWTLHHWVRGACLYGILPANGLLYAPPHPCACYIGAKLYGFTALAAKNSANPVWKKTAEENRLVKGSSEGQEFTDSNEKDTWPVYRQNNLRSGATQSVVKTVTKEKWQVKLGGNLTPPVASDNTLVIVQKNQATVNALDVASGKVKWRFTAGSGVDSAPTLYKKRCYFGCTDGFLYCLDLSSGKLIWKFQGAPSKAKHMFFEHIESTHPLHGSVLIQDDKIYAVAGRSMFIDGGMSFLILDAETGKKLKEINMGDKVPGTEKQLQLQHEVLSMPQALNDILSSNGKQIHMRKQSFDLEGKRLDFKNSSKLYGKEKGELAKIFNKAAADQKGEEAHIISGTGFLDDSWWHRTYWSFGKNYMSGWSGYYQAGKQAPSGRILNFDDKGIFGFGRMTQYYKWSTVYEYYLYKRTFENKEIWGARVPLLIRAMMLSKDKIYALGPEELLNQKKSFNILDRPDIKELAQKQDEAFHGKAGSTLLVVDRETGKMTEGYKLHTTPVFDGMVSAYNSLYISLTDGSVVCLGGEGKDVNALTAADIESYNKAAKIVPPALKSKKKKKKKK